MFPDTFQSIHFYQKKREVMLFKAATDTEKYILKAIIAKDESVKQAFCDEYLHLAALSHPSVPKYYGLRDNFHCPGLNGNYLTLCMEDCTPVRPLSLSSLSTDQIILLLYKVGETLSFLLDHGILYTDLNPSNLLVDNIHGIPEVKLIDYTFCYYFMKNPNPLYSLRFSYDLDPSLGGQQLLIQELSFLLHELIQLNPDTELFSGIYAVLETGLHPASSLTLNQYLLLMKQLLI